VIELDFQLTNNHVLLFRRHVTSRFPDCQTANVGATACVHHIASPTSLRLRRLLLTRDSHADILFNDSKSKFLVCLFPDSCAICLATSVGVFSASVANQSKTLAHSRLGHLMNSMCVDRDDVLQ